MMRKIFDLIKSKEFQKFFVIGISAFAVDFVLLQIILKIFNISEAEHLKQTVANVCSSGIAIIYNFTIQKTWAFKSKNKNVVSEASRFISVQIFNIITFQTIAFSIVNLLLPSWLTKISVTVGQIGVSFVLYKFFVFKNKTSQTEEVEAITSGLN
jgi:putative flippase GtrA